MEVVLCFPVVVSGHLEFLSNCQGLILVAWGWLLVL